MDKSIEAAVDAGLDVWQCGKSIDDGMRAAIAAYRDAEIERLTAALDAALKVSARISGERDDLRVKLEVAERDAEQWKEFLKRARVVEKGRVGNQEYEVWGAHFDGNYKHINHAIDAARGGERG